jgi:hypothetical protein
MKNGTPIKDVITPMGISLGASIVFEKISHNKRNAAPIKTLAGKSNL